MNCRILMSFAFIAVLSLAQDLQNQARTAVSEERFSDALKLYQVLLVDKPIDIDNLLWIARLSAWTGDHAGALEFYSQALALDAQNIDALVGKANVLMWSSRYEEAGVLLKQADNLALLNADVELAWSRYYHWQGNDVAAKVHLAKCLALSADNREALELKESLVADHMIEVRLAYEADTLPGTTPGAIEEIGASYLNHKGEMGVTFAHLNRFGDAGNRGGVHFSRKLDHWINVRGAALFGGGSDIVARVDLSLGISRPVGHGLVLGTDYRHIAFRSATVNSAIANVDYYFEKPIWILTSYAANQAAGQLTPSLLLRFNSRVRKNVTMTLGYGHGTEVFQLALPSEFGDFRRDSYIGGVGLVFTRRIRAETTYTLARRSTGAFENTFLLAVVHTR